MEYANLRTEAPSSSRGFSKSHEKLANRLCSEILRDQARSSINAPQAGHFSSGVYAADQFLDLLRKWRQLHFCFREIGRVILVWEVFLDAALVLLNERSSATWIQPVRSAPLSQIAGPAKH